MIYSYESIRAVHLELTDRCNAACPMCARYVNGEEASFIQNTQLSLDDIRTIFPVDFIKQLKRVNFCGNYGDPIVAKDLLPIISYLRLTNSDIRIEVNTNASARRESWWKALAIIMGSDENRSGVWFGLDGLGDTNHLYRRNTNWEVIMRNAKAFIEAGGIAHWNFIAFKHNEHQIPEAQALAKEMGFKHFNVKLTARFNKNKSYPVFVKGEHAYDLEPPKKDDEQRPSAKNHIQPRTAPIAHPSDADMSLAKAIEEHRRKHGGTTPNPIVPKPDIDCIAQQESSIYVSAQGLVYPCCWVGGGHQQSEPDLRMDKNNINPVKRSIKDIIQGEEFQMIEDSWEIGSVRKCVNICTVRTVADHLKQYGAESVIHKRADE